MSKEDQSGQDERARGLWAIESQHWPYYETSGYQAHLVGPIVSAAEAILYTPSDWEKFDSVIVQHGRETLNGRATVKTPEPDGITTYRAWTNEEVRRFWRLPKASTEARTRRHKWVQELSARPQAHCQILAALFGDVPRERPTSRELSGPSGRGHAV